MQDNDPETTRIKAFIDYIQTLPDGMVSTACTKISVSDDTVLYRANQFRPEARQNKHGWKNLLKSFGISTRYCYATEALPPSWQADGDECKPVHAASLAGHMTVNKDGSAIDGDKCYLMPLCHWHQETSRQCWAFCHDNKNSMLELSHIFAGESAVTFKMRLPNTAPLTLLYQSETGWDYRHFKALQQLDEYLVHSATALRGHHVFKRNPLTGKLMLYIR